MTVDRTAAQTFLYATARVLERRRYARLFEDGPAEPIVEALKAFRNADGGFGHAIEPDMRSPLSQPVGTQTAVEILHEAGVEDDALVHAAGDWLMTVTRPDGGIPFVLENALQHPHAPWWSSSDASSVTQTAANAAALHSVKSDHPWLQGADAFLFERIAALDTGRAATDPGTGYDVLFSVTFLDAHPDEARATAALEALGLDRLAPEPGSELPGPLDLSPEPGLRSRRFVDAALIDRYLDELEAGQKPDGGWTVAWPAWNDAATVEWRGIATVHALKTLRANNRI